MNKHLAAINAGAVTKTNVIGLRKALNADYRRSRGCSVGSTAPKMSGHELTATIRRLMARKPRVEGELHETGLKLLRSPRYRKRLAAVADIIADLDHFRLVGFTSDGTLDYPIYEARASGGRRFRFYNIPWQSGGNGPQLF